jgi:hypothetical protein
LRRIEIFFDAAEGVVVKGQTVRIFAMWAAAGIDEGESGELLNPAIEGLN